MYYYKLKQDIILLQISLIVAAYTMNTLALSIEASVRLTFIEGNLVAQHKHFKITHILWPKNSTSGNFY